MKVCPPQGCQISMPYGSHSSNMKLLNTLLPLQSSVLKQHAFDVSQLFSCASTNYSKE